MIGLIIGVLEGCGFKVLRPAEIDDKLTVSQLFGNARGHELFEVVRRYAYLYDVENRLVEMRDRQSATLCPSGTSGYNGTLIARVDYDPMGRMYQVYGDTEGYTRFLYDGDAMVAEYSTTGTMLARYIHGPAAGVDDPLLWYVGTGTGLADTRALLRDPRGSIVLARSRYGNFEAINSYDEYGIQGSLNEGRFQYTGQIWLKELELYYYKARMYSPGIGRFLQTDPIGYEDNVNLYAYVGNDPINGTDPTGTEKEGCGTRISGGSVAGCNSIEMGDEGQQETSALDDAIETARENILESGRAASEEFVDRTVTRAELGFEGEDTVARILEDQGYEVVARGLYVITRDAEVRIVDIVARSNNDLIFVEVKVNGSSYTAAQRNKDFSISTRGGYIWPNQNVNRNFLRDVDPRLPPTRTVVVRVDCAFAGLRCR